MPEITIEDSRTGQRLSPYLGGDPQIDPAATTTTTTPDQTNENKNDAASTTTVADPAQPAADPAAKPADNQGEQSDPVAQGSGDNNDANQRDEKGRFIPKARFDEVNERRKRAEQKLAQLEGEKEAANKSQEQKYDFDAAEKDYMSLILDGKLDEAAAKRREIRAAEQTQFTKAVAETAQGAARELTVKDKINNIAADYESRYPVFNPDSDQFSEDVVDDLQALYRGYLESGRYGSADVAFKAALDKTVQMHGAKPAQANGTAPASTSPTQARTAQSRVQAIVSQPPMIGKTGTSNPTHGDGVHKPSEMSEREIMQLSEAERRRLRGDFFQ